jgi:pilus assembly protein Flp/PilA
MPGALSRFLSDEAGATAIEYGLIAGLIAAVLVASFSLFGDNLVILFGVGAGGPSDAMADALNSR